MEVPPATTTPHLGPHAHLHLVPHARLHLVSHTHLHLVPHAHLPQTYPNTPVRTSPRRIILSGATRSSRKKSEKRAESPARLATATSGSIHAALTRRAAPSCPRRSIRCGCGIAFPRFAMPISLTSPLMEITVRKDLRFVGADGLRVDGHSRSSSLHLLSLSSRRIGRRSGRSCNL